jgi:hypothetical protein
LSGGSRVLIAAIPALTPWYQKASDQVNHFTIRLSPKHLFYHKYQFLKQKQGVFCELLTLN